MCVSFLLEIGGALGGSQEPRGVSSLVLGLPSRTYISEGSGKKKLLIENRMLFRTLFFFFDLVALWAISSLTRD